MRDLFPETIRTERLTLETIGPDSGGVFEHYDAFSGDPDPETVYEYVPLTEPETPADSRAFLTSAASKRDDGVAVTYLIRPREGEAGAGDLAGSTTLFVDWDRRLGQPAILLRKPFWGRGYSSERARALLALAFERLDLESFSVSCVASNERSKQAIEKYVSSYDGTYEGRFRNLHAIDGTVHDLHRFTISRQAYRSASDPVDENHYFPSR